MIDFDILCEVLDNDLDDVAIIIAHFVQLSNEKIKYRKILNDIQNGNIDYYEYFIECALDTPKPRLAKILNQKYLVVEELRNQIKELRLQLYQVTHGSLF